MHMQRWDSQMIRWMCEAMDYGSYNSNLADCIRPHLCKNDYICEAGCGLGLLSLELAKYVRKITAFDRNADALAVLKDRISWKGIQNIETRCSLLDDFQSYETPDAMLFCLFGSAEEMIASAERLHCEKVIAVLRRQKDELWHADQQLSLEPVSALGWQICDRQIMDIPLNQPFRNLNDARVFLELYAPKESDSPMTDEELESVLVPVIHATYRYELPVTRRLELLVLNKN